MSAQNNIPATKAIFDTHTAVRAKIEAANYAVHEALKAMIDFQDPMTEAVFGADKEILMALASASKSKLGILFMTGVPIFSLRTANVDFKAALGGPGGEDACLKALLATFSPQLPISSL